MKKTKFNFGWKLSSNLLVFQKINNVCVLIKNICDIIFLWKSSFLWNDLVYWHDADIKYFLKMILENEIFLVIVK